MGTIGSLVLLSSILLLLTQPLNLLLPALPDTPVLLLPVAHNLRQMLPIGGPGKALSAKEQAEILFRITGREPKYISAPVGLFDAIIGFLDLLAKFFPKQFEVSASGSGLRHCLVFAMSMAHTT